MSSVPSVVKKVTSSYVENPALGLRTTSGVLPSVSRRDRRTLPEARSMPITFTSISSPSLQMALPLSAATLYNVRMSRFTASQARQNFARVLDQAAGGQSVTIERGKLRFRLVLDERRRALRTARPVIEIIDPAVANGDWTWRPGKAGLSFKQRTKA